MDSDLCPENRIPEIGGNGIRNSLQSRSFGFWQNPRTGEANLGHGRERKQEGIGVNSFESKILFHSRGNAMATARPRDYNPRYTSGIFTSVDYSSFHHFARYDNPIWYFFETRSTDLRGFTIKPKDRFKHESYFNSRFNLAELFSDPRNNCLISIPPIFRRLFFPQRILQRSKRSKNFEMITLIARDTMGRGRNILGTACSKQLCKLLTSCKHFTNFETVINSERKEGWRRFLQ